MTDKFLKEQYKNEFKNKSKKPTFKLYKEVINNSLSSSFMMATKEWEIIDYKVAETNYCCICGHTHLKRLYKIKNKKTGSILFPIGASCINYFSDEKIKIEAKRIALLEKNKRSKKTISFNTNQMNFYLKTIYNEVSDKVGFEIIEESPSDAIKYRQYFFRDSRKTLENELLKYKLLGIMYVISLAKLNYLANVTLHITSSKKIKQIIEGDYDLFNPDIINFKNFSKKHLGNIIITELDEEKYSKIKINKGTILLNEKEKF